MAQRGEALVYAAPGMQRDRGVVAAATAQSGGALCFASAGIQKEARRAAVLAAVAGDGDALRQASIELRADKEVTASPGLACILLAHKQLY